MFCLVEMATTFALLDRNKDGRICANDMKTSMRLLNLPITEQVASNFVKKIAKGGASESESATHYLARKDTEVNY